jgi:hypothetical protein
MYVLAGTRSPTTGHHRLGPPHHTAAAAIALAASWGWLALLDIKENNKKNNNESWIPMNTYVFTGRIKQ